MNFATLFTLLTATFHLISCESKVENYELKETKHLRENSHAANLVNNPNIKMVAFVGIKDSTIKEFRVIKVKPDAPHADLSILAREIERSLPSDGGWYVAFGTANVGQSDLLYPVVLQLDTSRSIGYDWNQNTVDDD